jgi:hypothetical protein
MISTARRLPATTWTLRTPPVSRTMSRTRRDPRSHETRALDQLPLPWPGLGTRSTTAVRGRLCASSTGMNSPVFASRPRGGRRVGPVAWLRYAFDRRGGRALPSLLHRDELARPGITTAIRGMSFPTHGCLQNAKRTISYLAPLLPSATFGSSRVNIENRGTCLETWRARPRHRIFYSGNK